MIARLSSHLIDGQFVDIDPELLGEVLKQLDPETELWVYLPPGDARLPAASTDVSADAGFFADHATLGAGAPRAYYSTSSSARIMSRNADVVIREAVDASHAKEIVESVIPTIATKKILVLLRTGPAAPLEQYDVPVEFISQER